MLYGNKLKSIKYNLLLYVVANIVNEIQVFNLDHSLIRRFSTSPNQPFSITISSNHLYIGTYGGIVLVYQNEKIINQFNWCDGNSNYLLSILFDANGYMATTCSNDIVYLYFQIYVPNGSFRDKYLTTPTYSRYIGLDLHGRFFQISGEQISIYN